MEQLKVEGEIFSSKLFTYWPDQIAGLPFSHGQRKIYSPLIYNNLRWASYQMYIPWILSCLRVDKLSGVF